MSTDHLPSEAREPLTRERVLRAGVAFADEHGLDGLSMRRLGHTLGVEAMSLYNHVRNKDDLLDGMVEEVMSEVAVPPDDLGWREAISLVCNSAHEALLRHPWACNLLVTRAGTGGGAARMRYMESLLAALDASGLPSAVVYHAIHVIDFHIAGFTLQEVSFPYGAEELRDMGARFLETQALDEFPHLAEHVRAHLVPRADGRSGFEFGLDLVLDGLERLREDSG